MRLYFLWNEILIFFTSAAFWEIKYLLIIQTVQWVLLSIYLMIIFYIVLQFAIQNML